MDTDQSNTIDQDEFRAYAKKYGLSKIPPFEPSKAGSIPEMYVKNT